MKQTELKKMLRQGIKTKRNLIADLKDSENQQIKTMARNN